MNGKTLFTAADIIIKAGEQIEALMDALGELMENLEDKRRIRAGSRKYIKSSNGYWLAVQCLSDYELLDYRKKKPSARIVIIVALHNIKDVKISGWEPALHVIYGTGEEEFNLDDFGLTNLVEDGAQFNDRIWCYTEQGKSRKGFTLPLVKLNSKPVLEHQIVKPLKTIIDNDNLNTVAIAFPDNSFAFRFTADGRILNPETESQH
jgi:hypothetical protein